MFEANTLVGKDDPMVQFVAVAVALCAVFCGIYGHDVPYWNDDSPRCRISGICDEKEAVLGARCNNRILEPEKTSSLTFSSILAAQRDERLECIFGAKERAEEIREAIQWSWKGYWKCSKGKDELQPLTCGHQHWLNLTLTAVDSLDTLLVAELEDEFDQAVEVVLDGMDVQTSENCNLFETTIRVLGSLLSTYFSLDRAQRQPYLREYQGRILNRAVDLGSRLIRAFSSETGLPFSDVNLSSGSTEGSVPKSSLSEMTTLALEFTGLSRLTNDSKFEDAARNVYDVMDTLVEKYNGLLPQFISPYNGEGTGHYIMLGARTDSYYEYLLKQWIFTDRTDTKLLDRYIHAMQEVRKRLLQRTPRIPGNRHPKGLLYVSEIKSNKLHPKMDHLVCFLPGVLALGDFYGVSTSLSVNETEKNESQPDHLWRDDLYIAEELAETCYEMYRLSPTGLAPEIAHFIRSESEFPGQHHEDAGGGYFYIKNADAHNLLRPETVESLYILWKVTGSEKYRERAWQIFRAFQKWTRVEGLEYCFASNPKLAEATLVDDIMYRMLNEYIGKVKDRATHEEAMLSMKGSLEEMISDTNLDDTVPGIRDAKERTRQTIKSVIDNLSLYIESGDLEVSLERRVQSVEHSRNTSACNRLGPPHGYTSLDSVKDVPPPRRNKMESFWVAETLKYLYLMFTEPPDRCVQGLCDGKNYPTSRYPLNEFVFNTEAHMFPMAGPKNNSKIKAAYFGDSAISTKDAHSSHHEEFDDEYVYEDDLSVEIDAATGTHTEL